MPELIFVTGASGFLGSHIVLQLLNKGYHVRAAARGPRVAELISNYEKFGAQFSAIEVRDLTTDQFPEALEGVDAVIHAAAPLPGKEDTESMMRSAVEGTLNVVRQAEKKGIKRIVVTSSIATVVNPKGSFTDKDWHPIPSSQEEILKTTGFAAYRVAKTLAEKALWEFADAHPHIDITTVNPPFLYGPFAETQIPSLLGTPGRYDTLSTNITIYQLLTPNGEFPPSAGHADVRDIARAHILALLSPPSSSPNIGRKRIIIASPHGLDFKAIVDLIAEKRPDLKERLTKRTTLPKYPIDRTPVDFSRVENVLGMRKDQFKSVEETVLGTVDSLLEVEKRWVEEGQEINIPEGLTY